MRFSFIAVPVSPVTCSFYLRFRFCSVRDCFAQFSVERIFLFISGRQNIVLHVRLSFSMGSSCFSHRRVGYGTLPLHFALSLSRCGTYICACALYSDILNVAISSLPFSDMSYCISRADNGICARGIWRMSHKFCFLARLYVRAFIASRSRRASDISARIFQVDAYSMMSLLDLAHRVHARYHAACSIEYVV